MDNLWILIPLAPFALGGFFIWTRHQSRMAELHVQSAADLAADKAARHAATVTELEERIRVIERILTDGSASLGLAHQIEALREREAHAESPHHLERGPDLSHDGANLAMKVTRQ